MVLSSQRFGRAVVLAAVGATGVALAMAAGESSVRVADAKSIFCSDFVSNEEASWQPGAVLNKWARANPGEVSRWTTFADGICAEQSPSEPTMVTLHGKTLLAAGRMALPEIPPPTTTGPPPTTTTEPPPSSTLLPCGSSLDAAYDAAAPGDVIELQMCSYPGKSFSGTKAAPGVIFDLNGSNQGLIDVHASWIEFRDGSLNWTWPGGVYSPAHHVTFRNIKAVGIFIDGASDISILGGEIGPHASDQLNWIFSDYASVVQNVLIDGVYVHDNSCTSSGCHYEAIRIDRKVDGVVIRNSVFRRNAIFHIFLTSGSSEYPKNVTIEHNCFDTPLYGSSVVAIHDPVLSSQDPASLFYSVLDNFAETGSNFRGPFYRYEGNVFGPESTCDSWISGVGTP